MNRGFTLIELLVVVLIIGILASIALPQYQHAVLKSRFASLMPPGKALADSQEAYYMTHSQYATSLDDLEITLGEGNREGVELGTRAQHKYVKLSHPGLKNNLVIYYKHSKNYPGEMHCEALTGDAQATWLCQQGFGSAELVGDGATPGYTAYALKGTGHGTPQVDLSKYDVNRDGVVDQGDFDAIGDIILHTDISGEYNNEHDYNLEAADLDGDGQINVADFTKMGRILLDEQE